jgi:hypothetical protein
MRLNLLRVHFTFLPSMLALYRLIRTRPILQLLVTPIFRAVTLRRMLERCFSAMPLSHSRLVSAAFGTARQILGVLSTVLPPLLFMKSPSSSRLCSTTIMQLQIMGTTFISTDPPPGGRRLPSTYTRVGPKQARTGRIRSASPNTLIASGYLHSRS